MLIGEGFDLDRLYAFMGGGGIIVAMPCVCEGGCTESG